MIAPFVKSGKISLHNQKDLKNTYSQISELPESLNSGVIFLLIENWGPEIDTKYYEQIFSTLEHYYYTIHQDIQLSLVENFENALKSLNQELLQLIQKEEVPIDLNNFNILTGLLYPIAKKESQFEIHLSCYGNLKASLVHELPLQTHKLIPIIEESLTAQSENAVSLFTNIVSGQITEKDTVLLGNEALMQSIPMEELINIIGKLTPEAASLQLANLVRKTPHNFAGLILKPEIMTQAFEPESAPASSLFAKEKNTKEEDYHIRDAKNKQPSSEKSLHELIRTEEKTDKILSPIIEINSSKVKDTAKKISSTTKAIVKKLANGKFNLTALKKPSLSGRINSKQTFSFRKLTRSLSGQFRGLNAKNKTFFIVTVFLFLSFYLSTAWIDARQQKQKEEEQYRQTVKSLVNKKYQAESSIIYNEESKAKDILNEIQATLVDLPSGSTERDDFKSSMETEVEKLQKQVRRIVVQNDMETIAKVPKNSQKLALVGSAIFTYAEKELYQITNGNSTRVATLEDNIEQILAVENELILLDSQNKIYSFSRGELLELDTNLLQQTTISAMATYNGKVYLLSPSNNQIYKYRITNDALALESAWIKDNINVQSGRDLTIDGSIYVLTDDTNIITLRNGFKRQQNIETTAIDPPIKRIESITAEAEEDLIYMLDVSEKRLIVLDKTGRLESQYTGTPFDNIKDAKVSNNNFYLLSGDTIYKSSFVSQDQ